MPLSYRMERGPGIKDGFTREKRGRVSLHLVVMLRRGKEEVRAGDKSGLRDGEEKEKEGEKERKRKKRGGRVGEGSDEGKEKLCSVKERGTRTEL